MNTKSFLVSNLNSSRACWALGLVLALLAEVSGPAYGQTGYVPDAINYQGKLTNERGEPVKSGSYQVRFQIWKAAESDLAGDVVWNRVYSVHVVANGMFNVLLSGDATNSLFAAFTGPDRFLGLTIVETPDGSVTEPEIKPRQRLVSAPFAVHSYSAYKAEVATTAASATYAESAKDVAYSANSGRFAGFETNAFLLLNKPAQTQTLIGGLVISDGSLSIPNGSLAVSNTVTLGKSLTVSSNVTANAFVGYGTIPIGGIILWSGAATSIPEGWALCDGTGATPDLRGRFVVGAGGTGSSTGPEYYAVNAKGGTNFVTLTVNEMPAHSHNYTTRANAEKGGGTLDNHWNSTATANTTVVGGGAGHENRPPYWALCYIMRVK